MSDSETQCQPVDEASALMSALVEKLTRSVPEKLCAPANRQPLAESFVDMLGRLAELLERCQPLDHGQVAALRYFIGIVSGRHVGSDADFIITVMVEAARGASRDLRKARSS